MDLNRLLQLAGRPADASEAVSMEPKTKVLNESTEGKPTAAPDFSFFRSLTKDSK